MTLVDRYESEIHDFFKGTFESFNNHRGHVWIAKHRDRDVVIIEALTIEPPEGGQYEIAVRVPRCDNKAFFGKLIVGRDDVFSGYIAKDGFLQGVNTGGH